MTDDFSPKYGVAEVLSPLIRRITAPNAAPFTYKGTGTYIVGHEKVVIIDPGPKIQSHIDAILNEVADEIVSHILVTHNHLDHSPASTDISKATGAKIYAFDVDNQKHSDIPAEEGIDHEFVPDVILKNGDIVSGKDWTIEAIHTPGHLSNHLCFSLREEKALFSGDHVMGWSSSIVSPPDGDMQQYLDSLHGLLERDDQIYYPTHGNYILKPKEYVQGLIDHRFKRDEQIIQAINEGHHTITEMVDVIYHDIPIFLKKAAERSVYAHLIRLVHLERVQANSIVSELSIFKTK